MNDVSQPLGQQKPKLLDRVRHAIRTRHYSRRTEDAYVHWIKRFIFFFHAKRHPAEMGEAEVTQFLSSLAVDSSVAASTQNQALSALLFLYKEVLGQPLPWLDNLVYAHRPRRLPMVLSREEVQAILTGLHGTPRLMGTLLYGAGLRVLLCAPLRVSRMLRTRIRPGRSKGSRCKAARDARREAYWARTSQCRASAPTPQMGLFQRPGGRKYPNAGREWGWQWVFPATRLYVHPESGQRRRHHLHESVVQRAVKEASLKAGLAKPASPHALRHRLPRISLRLVTTFAPFRSCSDTRTSRPP